jgi:site-specific recombinase XerD
VAKPFRAPVFAPNSDLECKADEELARGFLLALGAGGRKQRTLDIYEESIRMLSDFAGSQGLPGLATMDRAHIRHWLTTLHQKGSK